MKRFLSLMVLVFVVCAAMAVGIFGNAGRAVADNQTIINFPSIWVGKDSKAVVMNELITKFNQENAGKIKVVVEEIADYDAYEEKVKVSIAAGQVPDLFITKAGAKAEPFYKSGKLMDLSKYMDSAWQDRFVPGAMSSATYQGRILAVPYEFGVTPVLYNSKLLEKAGYTEFPETYQDFFEMCDKMEALGITPMSQMTGANAWTSMLWYSQLLAAIGGPDIYERGFDDPAYLEAAKLIKKMFDHTTSDAVGATATVAAGHFLNERTAMLMNGPWFIGRIKSEGGNNFYQNIKVAPAPAYQGGKGEKGGYLGFVQALLVAGKQSDQNKEEAVVKFLKYLTEAENVKKLSMSSGALFVIKTEINPGDNVEPLQGAMINQSSKAPYIVPHFNMSVKPAVATEFPQALSALVLGIKTPEEFVATLKAIDTR